MARISSSELCDGKEKGVHVLDFRTGSGFNFLVVPDRGMDIAFAEYKGHNLAWMSGTGIVAPAYYEPEGWNWSRGFFGGLLTTCGLLHVGIPDTYKGEPIGAHGRVSYTPARNVSHAAEWSADGCRLSAAGEMHDIRPSLYSLLLRRRIEAEAGGKSLRIHDTVINSGCTRTPHQIIYHINAGFPILSAVSRLVAPSRKVTPRESVAAEGAKDYHLCEAPAAEYREKVYYHDMAPCSDGRVWVALVNSALGDGLGLYVKYAPENLPRMIQWKMMGEGTYVMGMEPSNSYGTGMAHVEKLGSLRQLEAGEQVEYRLEIGVLEGREEIAAFEAEVARAKPAPTIIAPPLLP
ncbi:MAG: aldose 1-epimerase family protein [Candidatus Sumerlaeaceae bacterium]|nr:aldose 1-epimerase family protein [Candidatus Sumerlaeaceae bacterium]